MTLKVDPVMYLISDPSIPMSKGKFGAQAGHASVQAYRISPDDRLKHIWDECGQQYAKVVLQTDDLLNSWHYISQRGFKAVTIFDEGRTEFTDDLTLTFLGVQIVDKNRADVKATFGGFKLYREPPQQPSIVYIKNPSPTSLFTKVKEGLRAHASRRDSGDT